MASTETTIKWKCLCGVTASHRCSLAWPPPLPSHTGCGTTQHCATWDWCHRCNPTMAEAARHVVKAISAAGIQMPESSAAYGQLMTVLRKSTATEEQPR